MSDHVVQFRYEDVERTPGGEVWRGGWRTIKGPWPRFRCDEYVTAYLHRFERMYGRRAASEQARKYRIVEAGQ